MRVQAIDTQVKQLSVPGGVAIEVPRRKFKERFYQYCSGFGNPSRMLCHNGSKANVRRALIERVFYADYGEGLVPTHKPLQGAIMEGLSYTWGLFLQSLPSGCTPVCDQGFLRSVPASKRRVYENAVKMYHQRGMTDKDCQLKSFVKYEKILLKPGKEDPAPRIIQSRNPIYHYRIGRFINVVEHMLYVKLGELWKRPTVMKGMNPDQVAECIVQSWNCFDSPVGVGLDAKRFDQHCSDTMLEMEHLVYLTCFDWDPELRWLLAKQLTNRGLAAYDGGFYKYSVRGCRMSGDKNTGLGNCILMCLMIYAMCVRQGLTPGEDVHLVNNGDDCVLIMDRSRFNRFSIDRLDADFWSWGYKMEVEKPVYVIEQIEFCQLHPVEVQPGSWTMVRNLSCMIKDAACLVPTQEGVSSWMGAIGGCGMALAGDVPVYSAMYRAFQRHGTVGKVEKSNMLRHTGLAIACKGMNRVGQVSDCGRVSFWRAFGIDPSTQTIWESWYTNLSLGSQETVPPFV